MKVVAFDCASKLLFCGLAVDNDIRRAVIEVKNQHGELLCATLRRLHRQDDVQPDWDLIACGSGPGGFSGVRVALATAKGLALASNSPFVIVPTLAVWGRCGARLPGTVIAVHEALRNKFYCQAFVAGQQLTPEWDTELDELWPRLENCPRPWRLTGPGVDEIASDSCPDGVLCQDWRQFDFIGQLIELAGIVWHNEGAAPMMAAPRYLRAAVPSGGNFQTVTGNI